MVKKLLRIPLLLGILLLLLNSCRIDDPVSEQQSTSKEKIAAFERFEKANNSNQSVPGSAEKKSYISYAEPFAHIISSFLKKNPEYEEKLHEKIGTIRLDVSSQTFGEKAKIVVFPVTENNSNKVIGSWVGRVNPERTWVDFVYLHGGSEDSKVFINTFQQYYNGKNKKGNTNTVAEYGDPYHQEIPEVTIIKMNPWGHNGGDGGVDDWARFMDEHPYEYDYLHDMNGDSTRHDDGGTYNPADPYSDHDPCSKAKSVSSLMNGIMVEKYVKMNVTDKMDQYKSAATEYSISIGRDNNNFYTYSDLKQGKVGETSIPPPPGDYIANAHTHPESGAAPPSVADLYSTLNVNSYSPYYMGSYIFANNGDVYVLAINDREAAKDFLQKYSMADNIDPGKAEFNDKNDIGQDYNDIRICFSSGRCNSGNNSDQNVGMEAGLAYVLEKYNTGISLLKGDKDGNFKGITTQQGKVPDAVTNEPKDGYISKPCNN